jgi:hypothetical protein
MTPDNFTRIGVTVREPAYPFSKIPAFGFETKSIRATEKTAELADKIIAKSRNGSPFAKELLKAGIERAGSEEQFKVNMINKTYKTSNTTKVLGYIPGIGTFIGLGRIRKVATNGEFYSKREFLRAAIETLSLGIFLIPVDIGVTIHRKRQWKKAQAELQQ